MLNENNVSVIPQYMVLRNIKIFFLSTSSVLYQRQAQPYNKNFRLMKIFHDILMNAPIPSLISIRSSFRSLYTQYFHLHSTSLFIIVTINLRAGCSFNQGNDANTSARIFLFPPVTNLIRSSKEISEKVLSHLVIRSLAAAAKLEN